MEALSLRERECVLTGALAMAGLLQKGSVVDLALTGWSFRTLQDVLSVSQPQVKTVIQEAEQLKTLVLSYQQCSPRTRQ